MLGYRLDGVDRFDVDLGVGCPPVPKGLCRAFGDDAKLAEFLGRVRLDLEPDAIFRLRLPDGGHGWTGIAGDHRSTPSLVIGVQGSALGKGARAGKGSGGMHSKYW